MILPLLTTVLLGPAPPLGPAGDDLRASFGFADLEIYELGDGVFDLESGDLNGDGRTDLGVVNNARSRIELLLRRAPDDPGAPPRAADPTDEANPIAYDARYDVRRLAVERRVLALALGDVDGDGRDEVLFATQGGYLHVVGLAAEPDARPRFEHTRKVDELAQGVDVLAAIDGDADGRAEVYAVGGGAVLRTRAAASGIEAPTRIDLVDDPVDRLAVTDLDRDGRADLLYVHTGRAHPLRFRLGAETGFGPRVDVELPELRSLGVHDLDGDGSAELVGVAKLSGRLTVWRLERDPNAPAQLARYSLPGSSGKDAGDRTFAVGDLDGDGADDVVAADPKTASVTWFRGGPTLTPHTFPSLVGVADPRLGDVDGDGHAELVCRSAAERMLGIARVTDGRLPFPETLGVDGEPVALDLGDLNQDGFQDAIVAVQKGAGRKREISLAIWFGSADGLADEARVEPLPEIDKAPRALLAADLIRTTAGPDVLLFTPGESAVPTLVARSGDGWQLDPRGEDAPGFGVLAGAGPESVAFDDLDGDGRDELLVGTANFVRAMTFEARAGADDLHPRVLDQVSAPASDADVEGCAVLVDPDGARSLVLRDASARELHVLAYGDEDTPRLADRVQAGRLDFTGLVPADVDGDGRPELVVLGRSQFGVFAPRAERPTFAEVTSHDPEREHVFLDRLAFGDLNDDGQTDVVVSESQKHALVLFAAANDRLERALSFPIYESSDLVQSAEREPREVLGADCNGDGKDDLALLVHDKLIVYTQE